MLFEAPRQGKYSIRSLERHLFDREANKWEAVTGLVAGKLLQRTEASLRPDFFDGFMIPTGR